MLGIPQQNPLKYSFSGIEELFPIVLLTCYYAGVVNACLLPYVRTVHLVMILI